MEDNKRPSPVQLLAGVVAWIDRHDGNPRPPVALMDWCREAVAAPPAPGGHMTVTDAMIKAAAKAATYIVEPRESYLRRAIDAALAVAPPCAECGRLGVVECAARALRGAFSDFARKLGGKGDEDPSALVDLFVTREAAREDELAWLRAVAEDLSCDGCTYGDDCPTFGSSHGRCTPCKLRAALKGGGA